MSGPEERWPDDALAAARAYDAAMREGMRCTSGGNRLHVVYAEAFGAIADENSDARRYEMAKGEAT